MKLINIGFGNLVSEERLVAIVSPDSAPIKRMVQETRERGMLIDATYGRRSRSVLVTDSDHIILSPIQPETIANRLSSEDEEEEEDEDLILTEDLEDEIPAAEAPVEEPSAEEEEPMLDFDFEEMIPSKDDTEE